MYKLLVFTSVLAVAAVVHGSDEGPDFSQGIQIIGKVLRHFINSQPGDLKISEGVHIISTSTDGTARSADGTTFLGSVQKYLQSHELRIKLPELMPNGEDFGRAFKDAVNGVDSSDIGTGRGKSKGGGGGGGGGALMMLGGMFGSMLGAMGIGGVGLLAMKALAVSGMALMLAAVVGIKKLSHSGDDGGHHVIHAGGGHGYDHRRKREAADLAYSAWIPNSSS